MVCFTEEDSWIKAREEKNARKCTVVGEGGEKQAICTEIQLSSGLKQSIPAKIIAEPS